MWGRRVALASRRPRLFGAVSRETQRQFRTPCGRPGAARRSGVIQRHAPGPVAAGEAAGPDPGRRSGADSRSALRTSEIVVHIYYALRTCWLHFGLGLPRSPPCSGFWRRGPLATSGVAADGRRATPHGRVLPKWPRRRGPDWAPSGDLQARRGGPHVCGAYAFRPTGSGLPAPVA